MTGGTQTPAATPIKRSKAKPRLVYKVDAVTGALTLVRGVELVGTPLTSINKILAAGADAKVFNGFCGAESGYVPVKRPSPPPCSSRDRAPAHPQRHRPPPSPAFPLVHQTSHQLAPRSH